MHAEHQPGVDLPGVEKKTGAKMRCHGAADTPTADDPQWRRPPCRTSMTFSASLLPPFVLQPAPDAPVIVASRPGSGCDTCRLVGRDTPPDTPPPISFV